MNAPDRVTYFAATDSRSKRIPFGIKQKDRARHMYVLGKSGTGKSALLENMMAQDLRNGEGFAYIDTHGAGIEKLLDFIPENRIRDVLYVAPADGRPFAFNILQDVPYEKRNSVVGNLLPTFKHAWKEVWDPRFEYILIHTFLALLEYPGAHLLDAVRLHTDEEYRNKVADHVNDEVTKHFLRVEFLETTDKAFVAAKQHFLEKIKQLEVHPIVKSIIGQAKSSFSPEEILSSRKVLLARLPESVIGEEQTRLLGSLLVSYIFSAAANRSDRARSPFQLYLDDFQNIATDQFARFCTEARKYNLNLIISHQYLEQISTPVRDAILGNVGTLVLFRIGTKDAEMLEHMFAPEFSRENLMRIGLSQIFLILTIDNVASRPFSASTIPPIEPPAKSYKKEILEGVFEVQALQPRKHQEFATTKPQTSSDLRSLLRSMTARVQAERQEKKQEQVTSLREIIQSVLIKEKTQIEKETVIKEKQEIVEMPPEPEEGPFEVPERKLREVFKEDV